MAMGDVVTDQFGVEYVVIWDGGPESASLTDHREQRPQPIHERSRDERRPNGGDRRILRKFER